jgi:hypothetical protein
MGNEGDNRMSRAASESYKVSIRERPRPRLTRRSRDHGAASDSPDEERERKRGERKGRFARSSIIDRSAERIAIAATAYRMIRR